jgi:hypothetical protein
MLTTLSRPAPDEYGYYERYGSLEAEGNLVDLLVEQQLDTIGMSARR